MISNTQHQVDGSFLARNARKLIRQTRTQPLGARVRIAILGGSTTQEVALFLELMLLRSGLDPVIWQSEYGRYWEDGVWGNKALDQFEPELVYVHTGSHNIQNWPDLNAIEQDAAENSEREIARFSRMWEALHSRYSVPIVQNNFELPDIRVLGNLEAIQYGGCVYFTELLNAKISAEARRRPYLLLNDVHYLSARLGLENWYDPRRWLSYKIATTAQANAELANNLKALILARYGLGKKAVILDLDNTLWGGVIGDEGADAIVIGRETPSGEAYTAFQEYLQRLRKRGIVLAVASKNYDATAREGFNHPDSVLTVSDFSSFKANWNSKTESIREIAHELNLGLDSFVFVDDSPAERLLVSAQLPEVVVPEIGEDPAGYIRSLDRGNFFETTSLSAEDFGRTAQYAANAKRNEHQAKFADYAEFLDFLQMQAETGPFEPKYFNRITQLTGKTNQFNLTTKRLSRSEIEACASEPKCITRYIRLSDRFGDFGVVSVAIGRIDGEVLNIELWLMSCRVLKREVELLMLDEIVRAAKRLGATHLHGFYFRTQKNDMVSRHYDALGFTRVGGADNASEWILPIDGYSPRNAHIEIVTQFKAEIL